MRCAAAWTAIASSLRCLAAEAVPHVGSIAPHACAAAPAARPEERCALRWTSVGCGQPEETGDSRPLLGGDEARSYDRRAISLPCSATMTEETLDNPVTGESMRILESTAQMFRAQYSLRPHGEIPGEHFHPHKEQRISVLAGEIHLRVDGAHRIVRAGETATVPAGARHFQWNPGDIEAVVIEDIRPAGRIHDFFKVLFGLARDDRTDAKGYPSLLVTAALFTEFRDAIQPAPIMARVLIAILGPIALALGYRRRLEKYLQAPGHSGGHERRPA